MTDRTVTNIVDKVNRFRSQGWSYEQIKEKLVKMGNSPDTADLSIAAYVKEMCGVSNRSKMT